MRAVSECSPTMCWLRSIPTPARAGTSATATVLPSPSRTTTGSSCCSTKSLVSSRSTPTGLRCKTLCECGEVLAAHCGVGVFLSQATRRTFYVCKRLTAKRLSVTSARCFVVVATRAPWQPKPCRSRRVWQRFTTKANSSEYFVL